MSKDDKLAVEIKDFSVSGEIFQLREDHNFKYLYTHPKPVDAVLPSYYQSADYISHTDSSRTVIEKIYQVVRKIALQNKLQLMSKFQPSQGALLDIGAGTGDFLAAAIVKGWAITGVEPDSSARQVALSKGISLLSDQHSLVANSFDVITMWHVLEHVSDLDQQIEILKKVLKPGGTLLIAVPNYKSFDAQVYGKYWAAYDVPRHLWHFSQQSIGIIFGSKDLQVVDTIPMKYDSFYVSMLSEKYRSGKINYVKAFYNGFISNWKARRTGEYSSLIYIIKHKPGI